ncbi:glycosyl transferase [Blastocladiella emersonii ATCC 22665]|nr:glycosyl transferase [Blastocladiella emersonii ATCC 22665]
MVFGIFAAATAIKLLLMPGYRSTDFEVHRNWLAITHSLPVSKWYYEATSEWTLDYPPFFAWFEYALSHAARYFDRSMLSVHKLGYASPNTVLFQRLSAMVADLTLPLGLWLYYTGEHSRGAARVVSLAVLFNAGLLIVDHIHFQYNGMLFGLLLLSLAYFKRRRHVLGAATFAALLNFKHIFLYIAPAMFVYLLSGYCFKGRRFHPGRFVALGATVVAVFGASLGPFAQHLPQLLSRLFPFKRGLTHAYWAPNTWALYSFLDRAAAIALPRFGYPVAAVASATRGLVGDVEFAVLPTILPWHTLALTVVFQLPSLWSLWRRPSSANLVRAVVHCGFAAFAFGWHVHEKAILTMLIPLTLIAVESTRMSAIFYVLSVVGTYSLFPLLIDPADVVLRWSILGTYASITWAALHRYHRANSLDSLSLSLPAKLYLGGLLLLEWFTVFGHALLLGDRLPFLPLMLTSVYSAVGVLGSWLALALTPLPAETVDRKYK